MRWYVLALVAIVMLGACGKDKGKPEESDPALDFIVSGVTRAIPELKAAIASPKPSDAIFKCAHMANIDDLKKSEPHKALAAELEQLCTQDLQVAIIKVAVEQAEAARKAKPDEQVLSECYSAELGMAKDELTKAGKLDVAKDLLARFKAACPNEK